MSPWPPPAIPPVLDELIVEDAQNSGEPAWGVVRKACRHFEFLLNLLQGLARHHHLRNLVAHHDEVVALIDDVGDTASDVDRPVTRHVGVDGEIPVDDAVENVDRVPST